MSSNSEEEDDEEYFNRDQDDFNDVNQSLMLSGSSIMSTPTPALKKNQKKDSNLSYDTELMLNKLVASTGQFSLMSK
jgi:hypothetical protein